MYPSPKECEMIFIDPHLLLNITLSIHFFLVTDVLLYSSGTNLRKVATQAHASLYVTHGGQLELQDINILMNWKYQGKASTALRPQ